MKTIIAIAVTFVALPTGPCLLFTGIVMALLASSSDQTDTLKRD